MQYSLVQPYRLSEETGLLSTIEFFPSPPYYSIIIKTELALKKRHLRGLASSAIPRLQHNNDDCNVGLLSLNSLLMMFRLYDYMT